MKKKLVFLSAGCVLASAVIAVSCMVALRGNSFVKSKGSDDFYSITIDAATKGVITNSGTAANGSFTVKTDQNKNDITFQYVSASYNETPKGVYISGNEAGYIYNAIGNEVRGMNSITIKGDNSRFIVEWGFEKSGAIDYVNSEAMYAAPEGTELDFNGDKPNFFKIKSGAMVAPMIYEIVIKYGLECQAGENPYRESGKIKYKLFHENENSYYKAIGFINDSDPDNPKNLTFASEFDGIPVTSIDGFSSNEDIESIDLTGSNVTEIFTFAFSGCTNLTTITGFDQITSFRYECLKETKIGGTLTFSDQLVRIEGFAFYNCDEITNVVFADGCNPTLLYYNAFNNCDKIVNCTIGNAMRNSVPEFYNCDLFANYITATDSVYFKAVDGILYSVEPNDKLKLLSIPAHNACENYVMPADVDTTREGFAEGNAKLKSFVYNDTITVVNNESFEYCTTLESVTIGASVSIIYNGAFNGCTSLSTINFKGTSAQWNSISFGTGWHNGAPATVVHCLGDSVDVPLS